MLNIVDDDFDRSAWHEKPVIKTIWASFVELENGGRDYLEDEVHDLQ